MAKEGTKPFYTKTEVAALIAAHATNFGLHTKLIVKSADQTVNNSDTLQDDDELLFAVAANEVWAFIVVPLASSSEVAGLRVRMPDPEGVTVLGVFCFTNPNEDTLITPVLPGEDAAFLGMGQDAVTGVIIGIVINGGDACNLQFQWAQDRQEESDTIVRANSCILAWKLA